MKTAAHSFEAPLIVVGDDDDRVLALALSGALAGRVRIVVVQSTAETLGKLSNTERVGAVVTRAQLGTHSGLSIAHTIAQHDPDVPVLVLAQQTNWEDARRAYRIGAMYLPRAPSRSELVEDVLLFLQRRLRVRDRRRAASVQLVEQHQLRGRPADLLMLIGNGVTRKELPFVLGISPNSVKAPLRILFRETGTYTVEGVLHRINAVAATIFGAPTPIREEKVSGVVRVPVAKAEPAVHPCGVKTGRSSVE